MAAKNKKRCNTQVCIASMQYNGLNYYLNQFAKFVLIFESRLKHLKKELQFSHQFPRSLTYFNDIIKNCVVHATKEEILVKRKFTGKKKATLFFTNNGCQFHGFLTHLRNSFCHNLLAVDNSNLLISDKSRDKQFCCKGYLNNSSVIELLKKIIAEYEKQ